ncbi:MAG: chemotaxis protein [Bdellovibrio sp.]|nr:chemotaxis protein [Bdellovibrio sp.]
MATKLFEEKGHDIRYKILDILDKAAVRNRNHMTAAVKVMNEDYEHAHKLIVTISALIAFFSVSVSFIVLSRLSKNIKGIIDSLTSGSQLVSTASHQIASASEELAQAATEQASSLEEAVAALEEMNTMVTTNATSARKASKLADETRQAALKGEGEIRTLTTSMQEISADSKRIEEIIDVIDDIAFQTNLLALNAAVEAARAGEQGKGFAVVAEAVRTLAQRSSLAAKDISQLIKGSVEKVSRKTAEVDQSAAVLKSIVESAKQVAVMNSEIAVACEEQASGIGQISKAMNQIDQVTQVNAATSEEAAAAAQELSAQSDSMNNTVGVLVLTVNGGSEVPGVPSIEDMVVPIRQAA